ncbi:MAG: (Fe-S)-binding protein [Deltaproteobacteria bacterium]|jgi:glycolate oxidase iron-sulfur subunit|nr:(Fe-S)-binding protein [Deltaproteobacteria bacterium]
MTETSKKRSNPSYLLNINLELDKCAKCGACRTVCPIYEELKLEKISARGKIALTQAVLSNNLDLTNGYQDAIDNCLQCLACTESCGSGVQLNRIIVAARAEMLQKKGLSLFKRLILRGLLPSKNLMDWFVKGSSLGQIFLFKKLPKSSGLRKRFPLPFLAKDQYVPKLVFTPFLKRVKSKTSRPSHSQVVFFTGCLINYVYPSIGESVIRVLEAIGKTVIFPQEQVCCGTPAKSQGDMTSVKRLAKINIEQLSKFEGMIITACASGGLMLKHGYSELFETKDPYHEKALNISSRTRDVSEYIVEKNGIAHLSKLKKSDPSQIITYHDPCHLCRGQQVEEQPRQLLKGLFGDQYVEMEQANRCCGSGGTYGLTHPEVSQSILQGKVEEIEKTSANLVITGCPGCMIQLKDGIQKSKTSQSVKHTMEVISQNLKV